MPTLRFKQESPGKASFIYYLLDMGQTQSLYVWPLSSCYDLEEGSLKSSPYTSSHWGGTMTKIFRKSDKWYSRYGAHMWLDFTHSWAWPCIVMKQGVRNLHFAYILRKRPGIQKIEDTSYVQMTFDLSLWPWSRVSETHKKNTDFLDLVWKKYTDCFGWYARNLILLNLCMLGNFSCFCCLLTFRTLSECQKVWIQNRTNIQSVLIWSQTVCIGLSADDKSHC